ncbi:MarR family transcriptional regulator [Sphingomonas sp. LB-2]|uniref:MarR family winged helix-turn-helix transcriptional regulator n=1 Tax=Sphingomonas caeni TaxID=2984949 RepID=UPI0022322C6C|nr:MarR family transcriptional regulator [Sphingomonas caeni]MCW3846316.1 MarR family transcriptional regulator [Sphingomonas caeni]
MNSPRDEIDAFHAQNFGYALARLHRLFHDSLAATLTGTGLHMGHVLILATLRAQRELHGESTLTQTRLAEATGIEKSSLVLLLDMLEREGWVERGRHPTDRRAHIIHLTEDGARRFEQVGQGLHVRQSANLSVLSAAEQRTMLDMMHRLRAHLEAQA